MDTIPPRVLDYIFSFLRTRDLFCCFSACKRFRERRKFANRLELNKLKVDEMRQKYLLEMQGVQELWISSPSFEWICGFENLKSLSFIPKSTSQLIHVLDNCPNLQDLSMLLFLSTISLIPLI